VSKARGGEGYCELGVERKVISGEKEEGSVDKLGLMKDLEIC